MKPRFRLSARFIGLIFVLLASMFGIITFAVVEANTTSLRNDLFARSKAFAALATKPIGDAYVTYRTSGRLLITQEVTSFAKLDDNVTNVAIADSDGSVPYSLYDPAPVVSATDAKSFNPVYVRGDDGSIKRIIYPYIQNTGVHRYAVVYDITSESINAATHAMVRSIVSYAAIGLAISTFVTYLAMDWLFLRPIKRLRNQATLIAGGHYAEQIPRGRKDEIGDLANSVNQMANSLKADIQKLKDVDEIKSEFMMIASHNLRTPLTIINGYVDMAKTWKLSSEMRGMLESIEANTQRLGIFAEDLLTISNMEAGKSVFTLERLQVGKLCSHIIDEFKTLAAEKQRHFTADVSAGSSAEILASPVHLRSAIWNLLDNALKFTDIDGEIELKAVAREGRLFISVSDSGVGIQQEEQEKLFTKFHRGTSTLDYNYDGMGIGLYITKQIVTAHKGEITVDSTPGIGTTFTISLPLAPPESPRIAETR